MTTYTVNTSPQAIYPDGHNDAFAITNNGPWTVQIDDNSAIGVGSYELPPTASIAWDAHRPLWIQAKAVPVIPNASLYDTTVPSYINSTIRLTRQANVLAYAVGNQAVLLQRATQPSAAGFFIRLNLQETAPWNTLIVNVTDALKSAYNVMPTATFNSLRLQWYGPDGTPSTCDRFHFPELDTTTGTVITARFVIPVKDAYCHILLGSTTQSTYAITVHGTTAVMPVNAIYWNSFAANGSVYPARSDALAARWPDVEGPDEALWDSWYQAGFTNQLNMSPVSRRVTISIRSVAIVGGTPAIVEFVPFQLPSAGNFIGEFTIPAGASTLTQTFDIPTTTPIRLRTAYAGAGSMRVSVVWS